MPCNLHHQIAALIAQDAALATKKQTTATAQKRNALLRGTQEVLKKIKDAVSS